MRGLPHKGVESVLHELLNPHVEFSRNPLDRLLPDGTVGALVPEFVVHRRDAPVLVGDAVHDNRAAVLHHVFESVDKVGPVGETHVDPLAVIHVEGNDADKEGDVARGEYVGDLAELRGVLQRVDVLDPDERRV